MPIASAVQSAMNEQINHELHSAYVYLSMAAYLESINLPGAAKWMRVQAREEATHAMKFFEHIIDRGGRVQLRAVEGPPVEFESVLDVFAKALEHEQFITGRINHLYGVAMEQRDFAAQPLLDWFVNEQVEEEKTTGQVVEDLRMIGDNKSALFLIDRELAQRGGAAGEGEEGKAD